MQKSIIAIGIIVLVTIVAFAALGSQNQNTSRNESNSLKWHANLDSALYEAKKANNPVFVDFYTTWCSYCKQLDENTFSDEQVKEKLSGKYVVAKIDGDKNPDIVSNYKINGYPTMLILDSNGNEIKRIVGYVDANTLLSQL